MLRRIGIAALAAATLAGASLLWANRPGTYLPPGARAELLVVHKSTRRMLVYAQGSVLRSYVISLGRNPVGPKRRAGDHRTPEGRYLIDHHNPNGAFYRSPHVSYPSAAETPAPALNEAKGWWSGPGRIRTYDQGIHFAPEFPPGVDYLFTRAHSARVGAGCS